MSVLLSSSDTTEGAVSQSVVILPGQASAEFAIAALLDGQSDGTQAVTIHAGVSEGGQSIFAFADLDVLDTDPPVVQADEYLLGEDETFTA